MTGANASATDPRPKSLCFTEQILESCVVKHEQPGHVTL
jgi:hypothetical protein